MTGGGFGGCTVNLVRAETAADFAHQVGEAYYGATGRHPDVYICEIAKEWARFLKGKSCGLHS